MDPAYRPSLMQKDSGVSGVLPFAGSDLVLSPSQWSGHVVGKVSSWIDLDSEDEILRCDSETTLKQEIGWASHLSLQACLLPAPKGKSCANYARCANQLLQGISSTQLWLRLPWVSEDDSWEIWNSFHLICEHHSQLSVALDVLSSRPFVNSLGRWFGESVRAAILSTDIGYRDYLQSLLQVRLFPESSYPVHKAPALRSPLMDNLEAQTYETFEDTMKYIQALLLRSQFFSH